MKIGVGSDGGDEIFGKCFVKLYRFGCGLWISGPLLLEGDISRAYDEFITKPIEFNPRDRFKHSDLYL
jgi:hypothetical protein